MAAGVGIDLLEIDRLERALERHPRLAERVFTEAERGYAAARARPARHLAARFAAKEAVVKALGLSDGFGLREVEVVAGEPPSVRLAGVPPRPRRPERRDLSHALARLRRRGGHGRNSLRWSRGCTRCMTPRGFAPSIAGRSRSRGFPRRS